MASATSYHNINQHQTYDKQKLNDTYDEENVRVEEPEVDEEEEIEACGGEQVNKLSSMRRNSLSFASQLSLNKQTGQVKNKSYMKVSQSFASSANDAAGGGSVVPKSALRTTTKTTQYKVRLEKGSKMKKSKSWDPNQSEISSYSYKHKVNLKRIEETTNVPLDRGAPLKSSTANEMKYVNEYSESAGLRYSKRNRLFATNDEKNYIAGNNVTTSTPSRYGFYGRDDNRNSDDDVF